ncbi:CYTH-like domain-containing protein [Lipomyces arxii]|uniref:CYTH-like domain-containing protein n=1 Tax=Lipomyces arxii TaxID=56418 RepID=UPI0034CDE0B3
MDLRSIINNTDGKSKALPPPPPPPPPINTRRTSSIADLLDGPDTPPPVPSPITSSHPTPLQTPMQTPTMLRAALSPHVSPTRTTRQLLNSNSRSRSMSITSITTADDVPSRQNSFSSTTMEQQIEEHKAPSTLVSNGQNERVKSNLHSQAKQQDKKERTEKKEKAEKKENKGKPKRYSTPPIYARKWTSNWRELYGKSLSSTPAMSKNVFRESVADPMSSGGVGHGTLTNMEPFEDLTRRVSSWIYANIADLAPEVQQTLEIEAKVGTIMSKQTRQRLILPVDTETLLNTDMLAGTIEFESNVGGIQHKAYHKFLNQCLQQSEKWEMPITFEQLSLRDIFYDVPRNHSSEQKSGKIRVSIDTKTDTVVQKIRKSRIRDLMIYFPGSKFDVRISLNTEKPELDDPLPQYRTNNDRIKDRVSYMRYNSRVDLTQVTGPGHKSHELEIELDITDTLKHIAKIKSGNQDDGYEESIRRFLDNVRILVRRGGQDLT